MSEDNLLQAWMWYGAGVLGLMLVWWRILRPVKNAVLRRQLMIMALALLSCPYSVGDGYTQMAPALLMLMMEAVFEGGDAYMRVGPTLLGVTLFAMVLLGLLEWWLGSRVKRQSKSSSGADHPGLPEG